MKIAHISDLHIGRRFEDLSLFEDQVYIFDQLIKSIKDIGPDVLIIAGDIYDKVSPSNESFDLWDSLLGELAQLDCEVIIIAGNHDSSERLGVGGRLLTSHRIHLVTRIQDIKPITLNDEWGSVNFYPIPFIKPVDVRNGFPEYEGSNYHEAFAFVLDQLSINYDERNVLIAHQFFVNQGIAPELSDSEIINVGGLDSIDVSLVENFDYVALGHIHRPQKLKNDFIRYSGTPLKYSFSEVNQSKSIPIISLGEKNSREIEFIPIVPIREVRVVKGELDDIISVGRTQMSDDFIKAIITDEEDVHDAIGKLRSVYKNTISLEIKNSSTQSNESLVRADILIDKSHLERFEDLYFYQHGEMMSDEQRAIIESLFEEVKHNEAN